MGAFKYCSSQDELEWYVHPDLTLNVYITAEAMFSMKTKLRDWIIEYCQGTVYARNSIIIPASGEKDWQRKIVATGDTTFFFEKPEDYTLFKLKWSHLETGRL